MGELSSGNRTCRGSSPSLEATILSRRERLLATRILAQLQARRAPLVTPRRRIRLKPTIPTILSLRTLEIRNNLHRGAPMRLSRRIRDSVGADARLDAVLHRVCDQRSDVDTAVAGRALAFEEFVAVVGCYDFIGRAGDVD